MPPSAMPSSVRVTIASVAVVARCAARRAGGTRGPSAAGTSERRRSRRARRRSVAAEPGDRRLELQRARRRSRTGAARRAAPRRWSASALACAVDLGRDGSRYASATAVEDAREAGHAVPILGREVRAAEERLEVGGEEDAHRPAARAGHRLHGGHVDVVEVGALLAVDLDRHEVARSCSAAISGSSNDSRSMTWHQWQARVADREEDRLVLAPGPLERLGPHGYQSTGLCACWSRYGLVSPASRFGMRRSVAQVSSVRPVPPAFGSRRHSPRRDADRLAPAVTEHARPSGDAVRLERRRRASPTRSSAMGRAGPRLPPGLDLEPRAATGNTRHGRAIPPRARPLAKAHHRRPARDGR